MDAMEDREPSYLHGAVCLLKECHETVESLFARFERTEDARAKRKIVEEALYELKIHATIEELLLHPALEPELIEPEEDRRAVKTLVDELQVMTGAESGHDARFAALSDSVRRHIRAEENSFFAPAALSLGALLLASAGALGQSNQGGGQQVNPNSSLNSIISGGSTGETTPIDLVNVPVTPASVEGSPASTEKDHPSKKPLPVEKTPVQRKPSDRALVRKVRGAIVHDLTLPSSYAKDITVDAAAGKVTLTGTALTEDDKYKIAAKAAVLVGPDNVVNAILVKPAAPTP
jgi:hypothetical protein